MDLSGKFALFAEGRLAVEATSLAQEDQAAHSIRLRNNLSGVLVEECVSISSSIIGPTTCFVGAHSYMNDGGYLRCDGGGLFIGRFCSIGRRVTIGAGMHRTTGLSTSPALRGVSTRGYNEKEMADIGGRTILVRPTRIGSDVWIGDGAVIMPGVSIGTGAIVAANAVVTRDVEAYSTVGGVPARVIKRRFSPRLVEALLASHWWECSRENLNALPLANVHALLEIGFSAPTAYTTWRLEFNGPA